jgi:hypothetical protein
MSATVEVPCILCGAPHSASVTDDDPMVMYYADGSGHPGSPPEVDWRKRGCACCDNEVVDHDLYWEKMDEKALDEWVAV